MLDQQHHQEVLNRNMTHATLTATTVSAHGLKGIQSRQQSLDGTGVVNSSIAKETSQDQGENSQGKYTKREVPQSRQAELKKAQDELDNMEEEDRIKQEELMKMKRSILRVGNHDLIKGYTEALVGEKLRAYENEEENQHQLVNQQRNIRETVVQNLKNLKTLEVPSTISNKDLPIEQQIDAIERGLKNQYYLQLGKVWQDDVARQRKESSTFSPSKYMKRNKQLMMEQKKKTLLEQSKSIGYNTASDRDFYQQSLTNLPEAGLNSFQKPDHSQPPSAYTGIMKPKNMFDQKKLSDISERNLQLLNQSAAMVYERQVKQESEAAPPRFGSPPVLKTVLDTHKATKQFASPLNKRLEQMKQNLHDLMFNPDMSDSLLKHRAIHEESYDTNSLGKPLQLENMHPRQADPVLMDMQQQIMRDLQDANTEIVNNEAVMSNTYDMLKLQPNRQDVNVHQHSLTQTQQVMPIHQTLYQQSQSYEQSEAKQQLSHQLAQNSYGLQQSHLTTIESGMGGPQDQSKSQHPSGHSHPNQQTGHASPTVPTALQQASILASHEGTDGEIERQRILESPERQQTVPTQLAKQEKPDLAESQKAMQMLDSNSNSKSSEQLLMKKLATPADVKSGLTIDQIIQEPQNPGLQSSENAINQQPQFIDQAENLREEDSHEREVFVHVENPPGQMYDQHDQDPNGNIRVNQTVFSFHNNLAQPGHETSDATIPGFVDSSKLLQPQASYGQQHRYDSEMGTYQQAEKLQGDGSIPLQYKTNYMEHGQKIYNESSQMRNDHSSSIDLNNYYIEEFQDKAFEEDFKRLVNRLNNNLRQHNRSDLMITQIQEDIDKIKEYREHQSTAGGAERSPFKSSHISHIQSLIVNRDHYGARLKQYDKANCIQSHRFIKDRIKRTQNAHVSPEQTTTKPLQVAEQIQDDTMKGFRPPQGATMDTSNQQSTQINSSTQMQGYTQQGSPKFSHLGLPFSSIEKSSQSGLLVHQQPPHHFSGGSIQVLQRINSPSTELNEGLPDEVQGGAPTMTQVSVSSLPILLLPSDQAQFGQLMDQLNNFGNAASYEGTAPEPRDMHKKIEGEVKLRQLGQKKFQDYLLRFKKDKDRDASKLQIEGINQQQQMRPYQSADQYINIARNDLGQYYQVQQQQLHPGTNQLQNPDKGTTQFQFGSSNFQQQIQMYQELSGSQGSKSSSQPPNEVGQVFGQKVPINDLKDARTATLESSQTKGKKNVYSIDIKDQSNMRNQSHDELTLSAQNLNRSGQLNFPSSIHAGSGETIAQLHTIDQSRLSNNRSQDMPLDVRVIQLDQYGQKNQIKKGASVRQTFLNQQQSTGLKNVDENDTVSNAQLEVVKDTDSKSDLGQAHQKQTGHASLEDSGFKSSTNNSPNKQGQKFEFPSNNTLQTQGIAVSGSVQAVKMLDQGQALLNRVNLAQLKQNLNEQSHEGSQDNLHPKRAVVDLEKRQATVTMNATITNEDPKVMLKQKFKPQIHSSNIYKLDQGSSMNESSYQKPFFNQFATQVNRLGAAEEGNSLQKQVDSNKVNFQSLKPTVANQLLILPDVSVLSPLHINKMSPQNQPSKHDRKQPSALRSGNQNKIQIYQRDQNAKKEIEQNFGLRLVNDNTQEHSKDPSLSRENPYLYYQKVSPSHQGGSDGISGALGRKRGKNNHILDQIVNQDLMAHDSTPNPALNSPNRAQDKLMKEFALQKQKTERDIMMELGSNEVATQQATPNIMNYIKVQGQSPQGHEKRVVKITEPVLSSIEGFSKTSRKDDILYKKKLDLEERDKILHQYTEGKTLKQKNNRNSKLHRYKYAAQTIDLKNKNKSLSPKDGSDRVQPNTRMESHDPMELESIEQMLQESIQGKSIQRKRNRSKGVDQSTQPANERHNTQTLNDLTNDKEPKVIDRFPTNLVLNPGQDSDANDTDQGQEDTKGFPHDLGPERNHGINVISKGEKMHPQRRYKNNTQVLISNARREKDLIEKQKRIKWLQQEQKRKRELRNKSVNPGQKDLQASGNFSMVKMNSLLTLEQLLDIHTQQVNDILPSFVIGGPQTMRNGDLSLLQPSGLGMQSHKYHRNVSPGGTATTGSQGFKIEQDQRFSSIKAKTVALKKDGSAKNVYKLDNKDQRVFHHQQTSVSRVQNHPNNDLPLSSTKRFKSSHLSNYMESKKVSTQEELFRNDMGGPSESSQMQHIETLMGARSLMGADSATKGKDGDQSSKPANSGSNKDQQSNPSALRPKGLNLTLQPFKKTIMISHPWQNQETAPAIKQKPKNAMGQSHYKSKTRSQLQSALLKNSPSFKMSPNRTQLFPLDQKSQSPDLPQSPPITRGVIGEGGVRASLDSKIQGFGQSSQGGGPNTTHRLAQEAIHGIDISGQDFTIEEKLHEESYLSKDNFQLKDDTLQIQGISKIQSNEHSLEAPPLQAAKKQSANMIFLDGANQSPAQRQQANIDLLLSIQPNIKIENNEQEKKVENNENKVEE